MLLWQRAAGPPSARPGGRATARHQRPPTAAAAPADPPPSPCPGSAPPSASSPAAGRAPRWAASSARAAPRTTWPAPASTAACCRRAGLGESRCSCSSKLCCCWCCASLLWLFVAPAPKPASDTPRAPRPTLPLPARLESEPRSASDHLLQVEPYLVACPEHVNDLPAPYGQRRPKGAAAGAGGWGGSVPNRACRDCRLPVRRCVACASSGVCPLH